MDFLATGNNSCVSSDQNNMVRDVYKGPVEISTEGEMDLLCTPANVGVVYKYVGATTAKYVNGYFYIITEV